MTDYKNTPEGKITSQKYADLLPPLPASSHKTSNGDIEPSKDFQSLCCAPRV